MYNGRTISGENGLRWGIDARIALEEMLLESSVIPRPAGNQGKKKGPQYRNVLSAFDIETTSLPELKQAFMYVWQWGFMNLETGETLAIYGRTWDEWQECCGLVCDTVPAGQMLVVLDHNLSFEFQFLREYVHFSPEDVFATDKRAIVKCNVNGKLEFRCTMRHSNTSLSVYTRQWNVQHIKQSGEEYGYDKIRYPWTELTEEELRYALYDVLGLMEAYAAEMKYWHDDLYTVPLTSTGYVRRICKRAWARINYLERKAWMPGLEIIELLEEAFRGGDTHASRFHATPEDYPHAIVNLGVSSWDRASSYPDVLVNCPYPLGDWYKLKNGKQWATQEEIELYIYKYEKAILGRVHFKGLRLKDDSWEMPYIPKSKAGYFEKIVEDNGRILEAELLSMSITDADWRIIAKEYTWDKVYFSDVYYCRYRMLPDFFRDVVRQFFRDKTRLKGAEEGSLEAIEYALKKALLNALYGMAAMKPIKESIIFEQETGDYWNEIDWEIHQQEQDKPMSEKQKREYRNKRRGEILAKTTRKAFLPYQIGVWCTAWARLELHRAMWTVREQGGRVLYVDTDSVKYTGNVDFGELNDFYKKRSEANGAWADNAAGKRYYMGVYDFEYVADFATMGAKKYAYHIKGEEGIHITIAGVNKRKGAKEINALGGFKAFHAGTVFRDAGGVQGVYNDTGAGWIEADGRRLYIGANICLLPDTYTLGLSTDYARILDSVALRGKIDGFTLGGYDDNE